MSGCMMLVPSDLLVAKKTRLGVDREPLFRLTIEKASDDQSVGKSELGSVVIGRAYYSASVGSAAGLNSYTNRE